MLRPHCKDVSNKGLIKYQPSASILLHGDANDEFHLELEEFTFHGHFLTCYVGKYSIIVLKLSCHYWAGLGYMLYSVESQTFMKQEIA